jgi:hypothetical protein
MLYVGLSFLLRANELDMVPATLSFNFAIGVSSPKRLPRSPG